MIGLINMNSFDNIFIESDDSITPPSPQEIAKVKEKAKKIKKAITMALVALAAVTAAKVIISSKSDIEMQKLNVKIANLNREKAELKRKSDDNNSKMQELTKKIESYEKRKKQLKNKNKKNKADNNDTTAKEKKAEKLAQALTNKKHEIDEWCKHDKILSTKNWGEKIEKLFCDAELLVAKAHNLTGDEEKTKLSLIDLSTKKFDARTAFNSSGKGKIDNRVENLARQYFISADKDKFNDIHNDYAFADSKVSYNRDSKKFQIQDKDGNFHNIKESCLIQFDQDSYLIYSCIMESVANRFIEHKISFDQFCTLSGNAIEKYGNIIVTEGDNDQDYEFNFLIDSIYEKFNRDEIDADDVIFLLERAANIYSHDDIFY